MNLDPTINFLGRDAKYWLALQERLERDSGYRAAELLEELVAVRGKLAFHEQRIREMAGLLPNKVS